MRTPVSKRGADWGSSLCLVGSICLSVCVCLSVCLCAARSLMPRGQHLSEMSEVPSPNKTRISRTDYVWKYEYYDDDDPVSFEGLKAHRYSIVIGFWVGLAVFVIFMFFVLTLLTKTGAPHPESNPEPCQKRHRLTSCVTDVSPAPDSTSVVCPRPLMEESRSVFQCYINEEDHQRGTRDDKAGGSGVSGDVVQSEFTGHKKEREANFLAHFNIPNFVNSERISMLGDDDLLLCEPPLILEAESRPNSAHDILR